MCLFFKNRNIITDHHPVGRRRVRFWQEIITAYAKLQIYCIMLQFTETHVLPYYTIFDSLQMVLIMRAKRAIFYFNYLNPGRVVNNNFSSNKFLKKSDKIFFLNSKICNFALAVIICCQNLSLLLPTKWWSVIIFLLLKNRHIFYLYIICRRKYS